MKQENEKPSFFVRIATWIVDKRTLFFLFYAVALIFSIIASGWVSVNNELTDYLPETTETRQGVDLMEEQFTTFGTARVMISNISYERALALVDVLEEIEGISTVAFGDEDDADDRWDHYRNSAVLFDVTFDGEDDDPVSVEAMEQLKERLNDYDVSISSTVGVDDSATLAAEMQVIMGIVAVVVVIGLLMTSRTYGEIPVLLITFVAAILINMGTNFVFGEISYISNSITSVLQMALSVDYAIILSHRFSEERENALTREACILALSKAIPEISASCLTTLSGLAAMMFMQFGIGFDMGRVLIKSIIISIITVFTLMPGLLMLFGKLIERTHHRNFVPKITLWGKFVTKLKFIVPPAFLCVLAVASFFSNKCPYGYGESLVETYKKSDTKVQESVVETNFGTQNVMAILVPAGDYNQEGLLLHRLESMEEVDTALGLANVEIEDEDYVLTDELTPRQFAEMIDLDIEMVRLIYTAYAADEEQYGRIINNIDNYKVPVLDMFLFSYDKVEEGYVTLDDEEYQDMKDMNDQIQDALAQLQGEDYSRLILNVNLPEEGKETFAFLDTLHEIVGMYYDPDTFYIVGDSTSDYDLGASFSHDNVLISVLSIVFVMIILLFTFQSVGMPVLLVLVIQGSIWINFAIPAIRNNYIFFMSYLTVSSIQMGANIDYAIVLSTRYQDLKKGMPCREAMIEALNQAFPTIITSGSMMTAAGILISRLTSDVAIFGVGDSLGRGTIISLILVIGVLPEILLLGDVFVEKTSFNVKYPVLMQTYSANGKVYLDGMVRGTISGKINAEVHGVLEGDVVATVNINQQSPILLEEREDFDDEVL